MSLKMTQI